MSKKPATKAPTQEELLNKPVWLLTDTDLAQMPEEDRMTAIQQLGFLKESGALTMILANPPGTLFDTRWDTEGRRWVLTPRYSVNDESIKTLERLLFEARELMAKPVKQTKRAAVVKAEGAQ